ncbi:hypothetical protein BLNAU_13358 [Blattamonas nauphoetae]|uniref:Uncharacterized protein n=1 Tax=Blattamonas nauphoetae TaxID=2049346 RepID=A0ABQ9XNB1_9EUKA|nr:hypothetical protein BLNAU_13358 [Blattamonas nauphoetae]
MINDHSISFCTKLTIDEFLAKPKLFYRPFSISETDVFLNISTKNQEKLMNVFQSGPKPHLLKSIPFNFYDFRQNTLYLRNQLSTFTIHFISIQPEDYRKLDSFLRESFGSMCETPYLEQIADSVPTTPSPPPLTPPLDIVSLCTLPPEPFSIPQTTQTKHSPSFETLSEPFLKLKILLSEAERMSVYPVLEQRFTERNKVFRTTQALSGQPSQDHVQSQSLDSPIKKEKRQESTSSDSNEFIQSADNSPIPPHVRTAFEKRCSSSAIAAICVQSFQNLRQLSIPETWLVDALIKAGGDQDSVLDHLDSTSHHQSTSSFELPHTEIVANG